MTDASQSSVNRLAPKGAGAPQLPSSARPLSLTGKMVVMLVDDQIVIGEAIRQLIAGEDDIDLYHCLDPQKALQMAVRINPTVILLDLDMPGVDGLELVKILRDDPATRATPILVLVTKDEPSIRIKAFERGANDYLVKFADWAEFLSRLRASR